MHSRKNFPTAFFLFSRLLWGFQVIIGTGLFSGYSPLFPGTAGSVIGLGCAALLPREWHYYTIIAAGIFSLGTWAADGLEKKWGKDAPRIVIDEVAGMILTLAPFSKDIVLYGTGFVLFRLMDILKPYPCRRLEKIHGGFGIMLDDIMAAIYACFLNYGIFILIG